MNKSQMIDKYEKIETQIVYTGSINYYSSYFCLSNCSVATAKFSPSI